MIRATADALALPPDAKLEVKAQLSFALSQSEMLLVLDAAENVISDEFAVWITEVLRTSPSLRLLVTSQQPLGLQGEQLSPLKPMDLPETTTPLKRPALSEAEGFETFSDGLSLSKSRVIQNADSVRLFVACVQKRLPDWEITPDTAPDIAEVCRTLDGIPLALELAAGQLKPGGERALLEGLRAGIDRLVATEWDRPARHRSMTAALDYAFARLNEPERQVLEGMSVLESGSFFEAAIEPLTGVQDGARVADALYRVGLLQVETSPDAQLADAKSVRYRMLNTVRLYGRNRIASHVQDAVEERIARHYLKGAGLQGMHNHPETKANVAWFRLERLNLYQGCQWALKREELELLCKYATRLQDIAWGRDERQMIQLLWGTAIEIAERDPDLWPRLREFWCPLQDMGFRDVAKRALAATIEQARTWGDTDGFIGWSLRMVELQLHDGAPHRAREYLTTLQATGLTANRPYWEQLLLYDQALVAWAEGQLDRADELLRQQMTLCEQHKWHSETTGTLERLASLAEARGDLAESVRLWERWIQQKLALGETHFLCSHWRAQGERYLRLNQPEMSETCFQKGIDIGREMGMSIDLIWSHDKLAVEILRLRGEFQEARSCLQEAMTLAAQTGHQRIYGALLNSLALVELSAGNLDEAEHQAAESLRIAEEVNHAGDRAYAQLVLGQIKTRRESFAPAERLLNEAWAFIGEGVQNPRTHPLKKPTKPHEKATCLLALGELYRRQGRWEKAETCYHEAERFVDREDIRCQIVHAQALLDETRKHHHAARTKWQEILPICEAWKLRPLVKEVTAALNRLKAIEGFAIYLFGSLTLKYKGVLIPLNRLKPYARELLAYLAFHRGQKLPADQILETLWGPRNRSSHPSDASPSLQTGVSDIRRFIESVAVGYADRLLPRSNKQGYCFDPDGIVWVDLGAFNQALKNANQAVQIDNLETAFNLWTFAEQLYCDAPLADWQDGWSRTEAIKTQRGWLNALKHWGNAHSKGKKYDEALEIARRILALEPTEEFAHRLAMRCLARLGRWGEATRQYQRCVDELNAIGERPSPETQRIYEQIRRKEAK
ncbi:tetratricopeptide repeat protein [Candidatus Poribacteria bacterium]|nr:tetratricopeptide repeat protein [Candidatus Poribacteria bacterium]